MNHENVRDAGTKSIHEFVDSAVKGGLCSASCSGHLNSEIYWYSPVETWWHTV